MSVDIKSVSAWVAAGVVFATVVAGLVETRVRAAENETKIKEMKARQEAAAAERRQNREQQIRYEANQKAIERALAAQGRAFEKLTEKLDRKR